MALSVSSLELTYILRCTRRTWDKDENTTLIYTYLTGTVKRIPAFF